MSRFMKREYYDKRAADYDESYQRTIPGWQEDLARLEAAMITQLQGRRILELASGTGYWSAKLRPAVEAIVGVDYSPGMLKIARSKGLDVTFVQGDAYGLDKVEGDFGGFLANFWFSHVPKERIESWLAHLHGRLGSGARVFMADNVYREELGKGLHDIPDSKDTYKERELKDGSTFDVLKNYFSGDDLRTVFGGMKNCNVTTSDFFWWVGYEVP